MTRWHCCYDKDIILVLYVLDEWQDGIIVMTTISYWIYTFEMND